MRHGTEYKRSILAFSFEEFFRRSFAFDPHFAVLVKLFLPDRDASLEFKNGPLAGLEGGAAVWGADADDDAGFAYLKATRSMNDPDVGDLEADVSFAAQSLHLAQGHRRVGFVDEVKSLATARPFTHVAVERDGRAALRWYDAARHFAYINHV